VNDFSYVAPPDDGLRLAMVRARGRRYRTAGFSTTTVAAAFAVLAAIAGGSGTQSLIEQPAPEQPAITQLVPGPEKGATGTRSNTGTTVTGSSAANVTPAGPTVADAFAPMPAATAAIGPTRTAAGKPYAAGPITRNDSQPYFPSDTNCPVKGGGQAFCPWAAANTYSSTGTPFQLYGEVCSAKAELATLHFANRNEVDFAVYQGTRLLWRWSQWHPQSAGPHAITVAPATCSQWTFDWPAVDSRGIPLTKGSYTLRTTFFADELVGKNVMNAAFTIS
jgi:hypothetical protein